MSELKLSIGMAAFDDFHGVIFSIQALAMYQDLSDCEIVVVDNNPTSAHGDKTRSFCEGISNRQPCPVRYVPMPEKTGTSQSRQRIFDEARGDAVLVMDCHVLLQAGAIARLKQWYADNPKNGDLFSGPLVMDNLASITTHFNNQWRGGMLGTWGAAYTCTCQKPLQFTAVQMGEQVEYRDLATSTKVVSKCPSCYRKLPPHGWSQHEAAIQAAGFKPLGFSNDDPPFEIPAQGLGAFTCRRDAWLGFNPHFRGFGGEELYIHEKFRQAGQKAICLPWLKWWHRFARPDGVSYPLTTWLKVRNYVLGHNELGWSLDEIHQHFVIAGADGQQMPQAEWDALIQDPEGQERGPAATTVPNANGQGVQLDGGRPQPPADATLEEIHQWGKTIKRDLNEHLDNLRLLAEQCDHVTEFSKRRESTLGLIAGRPTKMVSYAREKDLLLARLSEAIKADAVGKEGQRHVAEHVIHWDGDSLAVDAIEETDLLYLDTFHHGERLAGELDRHAAAVRRFLVIRCLSNFGENGEGGSGMFPVVRAFLQNNPEWFVSHHWPHQHGITVLSRDERDRPGKPIMAWPPGYGPGTELKAMLSTLGIDPPAACDCKAKAQQMDVWGVEGCRQEFEQIVGWMREGAPRWSWSDKISAAAKAVTSGLAFKLNPLDPFPGIIEECIARAERQA